MYVYCDLDHKSKAQQANGPQPNVSHDPRSQITLESKIEEIDGPMASPWEMRKGTMASLALRGPAGSAYRGQLARRRGGTGVERRNASGSSGVAPSGMEGIDGGNFTGGEALRRDSLCRQSAAQRVGWGQVAGAAVGWEPSSAAYILGKRRSSQTLVR